MNHKVTSRTIQECVDKLKAASQGNEVELIWIPGHEGFEGNEKADELAKQGAANTEDENKIKCKISINSVRAKVKQWLINQTNKNFNKTFGARHSKAILEKLSEKRTNQIISLKRPEMQNVLGFITGHGSFRSHLCNMKVINTASCKYCEKDETAEHIMCECDAYAALRQLTIGQAYCSLQDYRSVNFHDFREFCKKART